MGKTSAPPLDGEAIRAARHAKFLTQLEVATQVAQQLASDGIRFDRSSLSLIENGDVLRPNLKVVRALTEVLGMTREQVFKTGEPGSDEEDDGEPEDEAALAHMN
jgi:transcriptional regulator with XRE-family HTH domain